MDDFLLLIFPLGLAFSTIRRGQKLLTPPHCMRSIDPTAKDRTCKPLNSPTVHTYQFSGASYCSMRTMVRGLRLKGHLNQTRVPA